MDNAKEMSRETFGLMFAAGGLAVIAVALALYHFVGDYPMIVVYFLIIWGAFDVVIGLLISKGVLFKNFRSKSDILLGPRR